MTKLYIDSDTVYTIELASGAADTTVTTSGSGISLINTSAGGQHVLNSVTAGANVTITDDNAGNLTIAATEDNLSNNTTSDLTEGTNLYYTDARVDTALTTVGGNIVPTTDNTQYLGSTSKRWHSLYLGPGSLYIDGHKVLGYDSGNDEILVTTDDDQSLDISAGGSGTNGTVKISSAGGITSLDDAILHIGPQAGGNTVYAHGTLEAPDLHNGDLEFSGTLINQTGSNQNLEIRTNGTGYIHWNSADVYVGPIAGAVKIDESSITTTAGDLTISATGNVNVAGHYTSAETDSAISTATAALVDSAPAALDTLNELASALGDDANFSTTVTNSIGTKWTQDNTKISNWDTAYGWGNHATPGYITGYTVTESDVTGHQAALTITQSQISDLTHFDGTYASLTGKPTIPSNNNELTNGAGYITTYDPTEADITQHQAALTITESQISDLDHLTTAEAISAVEGEATLDLTGVLTGTTALLSGSSGGLTSPILELETDNSGWNRPALMIKDSNADAVSIVGEHNTTYDYYSLNYTLDPNNDNGDTSTTNFAGDYYVAFQKDYSTPSAVAMKMDVFGANDGFNLTARSDFNNYPSRYSARPIRLKGQQIELYASDDTTPFGSFTEQVRVKKERTTFNNIAKLTSMTESERDAITAEVGDIIFCSDAGSGKFQGYNGSSWVNFHG